jgi:Flp pilus assembly protein TadD
VPTKQTARIKSIGTKINSNEEVAANIKAMYGKLTLKLPAAEKLLITKFAAKYTKGTELTSAAVTATFQGRNQAAMGLAMLAVIAEPGNLTYQNNLAAKLTNNGYPENAIPFLRKLNKEVSGNSTVLNNLGYAWLNLGETDSAKHFFSAGRTANPEHPDVICDNGLVEELSGGDPIEIFEDTFKKSPNVITAKLGENRDKIFEVKILTK